MRLRDLPVLQHEPPAFVTAATPADMFRAWLEEAVAAGVTEPHAMTLSTVDADGNPDARVLILKALDPAMNTWSFASEVSSVKAKQLKKTPSAALTFYWPTRGRQIRVRGAVVEAPDEVRDADFAERSPAARALVGGAENWRVWAVEAREVEFWQASPDRVHRRLFFTLTEHGWVTTGTR